MSTTPSTAPETEAPLPPIPTTDELRALALRVAVRERALSRAKEDRDAIRGEAEAVFMVARRAGTPQQEAVLDDGTKVGLISIERGGRTVRVFEDELLFLIATTEPSEIEEYVLPDALIEPAVLEILSKHLPEMVGRRIRRGRYEQLMAEIDERRGYVVNQKTGDKELVAEITDHEATGKFSFRPDKKTIHELDEAIAAGRITEDGQIVAAPAAQEAGDQA